MSVDIKWENITSGADGAALAEKVRDFVHQKFQQVPLPRFINAVSVQSFEFGSACPEIEIKDLCDPLPDFYDDDDDESDEECVPEPNTDLGTGSVHDKDNHHAAAAAVTHHPHHKPQLPTLTGIRDFHGISADHLSGLFPGSTTPGIPGGTSNLSYFHFPAGGLSGTQTPLAAVASGTPFTPRPWSFDLSQPPTRHQHGPSRTPGHAHHGERELHVHDDPSTRPSTANSMSSPRESESGISSPQLQHTTYPNGVHGGDESGLDAVTPLSPSGVQSRNPSDLQVIARVKYSGDVRMTLTAELLLDYPMPSFVRIPLKLAITGMTFDGVAVVAWIKKRMHFCFLDSEDASALVGETVTVDQQKERNGKDSSRSSLPGPLQEIHVESEIGRQEDGKQVLKNVGKVEKFVLEQVRKIFEEEFVFPSYWTFLV